MLNIGGLGPERGVASLIVPVRQELCVVLFLHRQILLVSRSDVLLIGSFGVVTIQIQWQ